VFTAGKARLIDNARMIAQFCGLERRTYQTTGREVIDHGRNGFDDVCNAVAGAIVLSAREARQDAPLVVMPFIFTQPRNFPGSSLGDGGGDWQSWLIRPGFWG
jgi:hypothetical protein